VRTCPVTKKRCDCPGSSCPLDEATRPRTGRSPDDAARDVIMSVSPLLVLYGRPVMPMRLWIKSEQEGRVHACLCVPVELLENVPALLASVDACASGYMPLGTVEVGHGREPQLAQAIRDGLMFAASMAATHS
jgi:hypothetical protein